MSENQNAESLSADEQAYFESRGEKDPVEIQQPAPEVGGEPNPDEQQEVESKGKERQLVPLNALHEEREEKKELRRQLQEFERKQAVLEDRWNTILKMQQPEQAVAEVPQPPDPEQDIFAALKWEREQREALEAKLNGQEQATKEQQEHAAAEKQIWGYWEASANEFAKGTADFGDAATFLAEVRDKQLTALSIADPRFSDKRVRDWQMNEELKQIIVAAGQAGKSPAQAVYEIAKAWGYSGPTPKEDNAQSVEKLAAAISGETSLSTAGGGKPAGTKGVEDIAAMSESEFAAWLDKNGSKGFKNLMTRG